MPDANERYEPKIVGFLCTWCSYTGADTAGIARLKGPASLRGIRVPCSGRVSPELIMRTFDQGADGVLVLGCHLGECHYETGNHRTAKRMPILRALMEHAGLEPERLRLDWVSASEGERFARIAGEFAEAVGALGPCRWRVTSRSGEGRRQGAPSAGRGQAPRVESRRQEVAELPPQAPSTNHQRPTTSHQRPLPTAHYPPITESVRSTARELLATGQVECVIGYEVGPRGRTRPAFVHRPEDADRLTWNADCTHNLTAYLREKLHATKPGAPPRRVAVVVKPCDSRAINVLLAEQQFAREQVHVIGVACEGIREGAGFEPPGGDGLQARCLQCTDHEPIVYDTLVGEAAPPPLPRSPTHLPDQLESSSPAERAEFWLSQFDRCIRCYACRQVCPMCNCPTCLYERDDSLWVGMRTGVNEKRTFHLGRAFHLAGRCIGCDECERVCPMHIPIGLLNRKLAQEVEVAFGHRAGDAPVPSPFVTVLGGEEGRS